MKTASILPFWPLGLISLADMIELFPNDALVAASRVQYVTDWIRQLKDQKADQTATMEILDIVRHTLEAPEQVCKNLNLIDSQKSIERIKYKFRYPKRNVSEVYTDLRDFQDSFIVELRAVKCALIPAKMLPFFEQEKLFGDAVHDGFEEARYDIKSAGNCIAADLNTAAVFHLMRVAELGLRKLAKSLKVVLPCDIEFATWGDVTKAIDDELKRIKSTPKTKARDKKLQRCSELLLDIRAFQYLWRDPVMHARSRYDADQARSVFNHIRGFMQTVADKSVKRP